MSNQYDAQGLDFVNGIYGGTAQGGANVDRYPVVATAAAGQAQSGNQVADADCANGEFPNTSIRGNLHNSAQNVSVYLGFAPMWANPPTGETVTMNGYDVSGDVVKTASVTVPADQGTHTLLAISSSLADIVGFDVTANYQDVTMDDLTFDNPGGVPADFALGVQNGLIPLAQGEQATDTVSVERFNGSLGDITFSASGMPAGVSVSFSPNPATGNTTTMTVSW